MPEKAAGLRPIWRRRRDKREPLSTVTRRRLARLVRRRGARLTLRVPAMSDNDCCEFGFTRPLGAATCFLPIGATTRYARTDGRRTTETIRSDAKRTHRTLLSGP